MSESSQKISRGAFYERIWNTPIVKLGKELGYSYLEMVQLCQKLNVPRPDGGYWFRLRNGGAGERIALPPANPDTPLEISYGPGLNEKSESAASENHPASSAPPIKPNAILPHAPETIVPGFSNHPVALSGKSAESVASAPSPNEARVAVSGADKGEAITSEPTVIRFTRCELYEAVWSKSCQKLAAELGISDVALAKTCKRMGIPRPSLGYWARVAAGEKVSKTPLPLPQAGQDRVVTFDVSANKKRREEWRSNNSDVDALAVDLTLPAEGADLHPIAIRHLRALEKKKPDENGYIALSTREVFRCDLTLALVTRLCGALHAILVELEARGYKFRSGADQFSSLRIVKGTDDLTISCSEAREQFEREPTQEEKRKPSWTWQLKGTRATGRLTFEVRALGLRGRHTWTESETKPLEEVLGIVVEKVDAAFRGFEDQRKSEIEAAKRREEEEKRAAEAWQRRQKEEAERERKRRHESKLAEIAETRRDNLFAAAHAWMESGLLNAYADDCERRWREKGDLSPDQHAWLAWAREIAAKLNPQVYPDPVADGRFDPNSVPFGGPYPKAIPLIPKKVPGSTESEVRTVYVEKPYQYPFWIKYRGR